MLRRTLLSFTLVAAGAAPLAAQAMNHDPDRKVEGGTMPSGWTGRTDHANSKLSDTKFAAMAPGFHITSGPAAIYWNGANRTTGAFTETATFYQMKAPTHPEAYGVFFHGENLDAANQSYFYFLVRGDGKVTVKHRAGSEVHTLMDWTENAAVQKQDAEGKARNTLVVDASKADSVRFLVNGKQVAALASSQTGALDGYAGLRVNHNLDVHVSEFTVTGKGSSGTSARPTAKAKLAAKKASKR